MTNTTPALIADSATSGFRQGTIERRDLRPDDVRIAIAYAGGPATGPLAPQGSWAEQVQGWVAAQDPDVVVLEACCNYTLEPEARYVDVDGTPVAPGSPAVAYIFNLQEPKVLVASTDNPTTTADTELDQRSANCSASSKSAAARSLSAWCSANRPARPRSNLGTPRPA